MKAVIGIFLFLTFSASHCLGQSVSTQNVSDSIVAPIQDTDVVSSNQTYFTMGIGFSSGANVFINQKIDFAFISLGGGLWMDRYTLSLRLGIGPRRSGSTFNIRYTIIPGGYSKPIFSGDKTLTFYYQNQIPAESEFAFFGGIGFGTFFRFQYSFCPFAEIGLRF